MTDRVDYYNRVALANKIKSSKQFGYNFIVVVFNDLNDSLRYILESGDRVSNTRN